jgi:polyphosphate kinase
MPRNTQRKKQFAGRDKSWMNFNRRVLEEAEDDSNPILERVKFLAITGSNLDEYVEIRLAGLLQRTEDGHTELGYDGLPPHESLDVLTSEMHDFVAAQYRCWKEQLLPELREHGIRLLAWDELSEEQRGMALAYFQREVDPLLTPITIDPAHPFPRVLNRALCLAMLLRPKRRSSGPAVLGVLTVPRASAQIRSAGGCQRQLRLHPAARSGGAKSERHVSRIRSAGPCGLPGHAQLESLLRGRRNAVACWSRFAANCITGARATRCGWRS